MPIIFFLAKRRFLTLATVESGSIFQCLKQYEYYCLQYIKHGWQTLCIIYIFTALSLTRFTTYLISKSCTAELELGICNLYMLCCYKSALDILYYQAPSAILLNSGYSPDFIEHDQNIQQMLLELYLPTRK